MEKYILTNDTIKVDNSILHRIRALRDFDGVNKGDLGGFVESEENLSHEGNCWIYDDAMVMGNSRVENDAKIYDNVIIQDFALLRDKAIIYNRVKISGHASVFGSAEISGEAIIKDSPVIKQNAMIRNQAIVSGNAYIFGYAVIVDNAIVKDQSYVCGDAFICGNAIIGEHQSISTGIVMNDLSNNLVHSIFAQTGLVPVNGKVTAYKIVNSDLSSIYDSKFFYNLGMVEVENPDLSNKSCSSGLHFSYGNYLTNQLSGYCGRDLNKNFKILIAEINLNDIITAQRGKIRCKRANITDIVDLNFLL